MDKKMLDEIKRYNQTRRIHQTAVGKTISVLIDEIEELHIKLELAESVTSEYARVVQGLRSKLEIANSKINEEDIENPYATR